MPNMRRKTNVTVKIIVHLKYNQIKLLRESWNFENLQMSNVSLVFCGLIAVQIQQ